MAAFSWSNANFNSGGNKQDKLSDIVDVVVHPDKEYVGYRFIGNARATAVHWIMTLGKSKDKKKDKVNFFPKSCVGFDPETMEVDGSKCPYCTILELNPRIEVRQNVINRARQENEPRRKAPLSKKERRLVEWNGGQHHIKEGKDIGGWTPVQVLTVTPAVGNPLKEITSLNKHKVKGERKVFGPDHRRFGFDVMIKYDAKAKAVAQMYSTQKGEITPLTEEELEYAIWEIPEHAAEEYKAAEKEAKRVKKYLCSREGVLTFPDEGNDDEDDGKPKKKRNQYRDSFDDDDDVEAPKKKKLKSKKASSFDDDDDGETPFDTDDDEDDDVFTSRSSTKKKKKLGIKTKVKSRARAAAPTKVKLGALKALKTKKRKFRSSYDA